MLNPISFNKVSFKQAIPDTRPSTSTGFMDDRTGQAVPDPRMPEGVDKFVFRTPKHNAPQAHQASLGDAPDLERFKRTGVPDTTGTSSTGYVLGGHSV